VSSVRGRDDRAGDRWPIAELARDLGIGVRLPKQAIGYSPAARSLGWRKSLRLLWATALGTIPQ
jgi:hypothetical protein